MVLIRAELIANHYIVINPIEETVNRDNVLAILVDFGRFWSILIEKLENLARLLPSHFRSKIHMR